MLSSSRRAGSAKRRYPLEPEAWVFDRRGNEFRIGRVDDHRSPAKQGRNKRLLCPLTAPQFSGADRPLPVPIFGFSERSPFVHLSGGNLLGQAGPCFDQNTLCAR